MPGSRRTGTRGPVQRNPNAPGAHTQTAAAPRAPAPAPRPAAVAPAPAAATPAAAPAGGAPGMFGNFVSTMAGATAGSIIGHTVAHGVIGAFSGGKDEAAPAPAAAHPAEAVPPAAHAQMVGAKDKRGPCWAYQESLYKCMENNSELTRCSWAHDMLKDCQNQYKPKDV